MWCVNDLLTQLWVEHKIRLQWSDHTQMIPVTADTFFFRSAFGSRESSPSEKQLLTIYDLDNKFIAYSASLDDVIDVVAEWGSFYILTRDGKMFVLQEKDTQTKLEVSQKSASDNWKEQNQGNVDFCNP